MGFDRDSTKPVIQPQRRTTKVNFGIAIAVICFFLAGAIVVVWLWKHPRESAPEMTTQKI